MSASLSAVRVAADGEAWSALGFDVGNGVIAFHNGSIELVGGLAAPELVVSEVALASGESIDGVPVSLAAGHPTGTHPNTAFELDHIVLLTDSLERTSSAVEHVFGLGCRRVRRDGAVRQAFHRFDDTPSGRGCIVEIVEREKLSGAALWGVVFNVADLDAICERLGPSTIGEPRPAVQPGRRIASVRSQLGAGLGLAVALMMA